MFLLIFMVHFDGLGLRNKVIDFQGSPAVDSLKYESVVATQSLSILNLFPIELKCQDFHEMIFGANSRRAFALH